MPGNLHPIDPSEEVAFRRFLARWQGAAAARVFEYLVRFIPGSQTLNDQQRILNELGSDGWRVTHVIHPVDARDPDDESIEEWGTVLYLERLR